MKEKNVAFDKNVSLALKGIAIIMLLLHHSFRYPFQYEGISALFFPFNESQLNNISDACKICVSIFTFISGYGLFLNYQNKQQALSVSRWCLKRYIKTFSNYWFVWLLIAIICQLINGRTIQILFADGGYKGITYSVIDFIGIAKIFETPTLDGVWWYMSVAFVFILAMPMIYHFKDNLWLILIIPGICLRVIMGNNGDGVFTGGSSVFSFITPFVFGNIFARYHLFERWIKIGEGSNWIKAYKFVAEAWIIMLGYKFYHNIPIPYFWEYHYGIFAVMVILFLVEFIIPNPIINRLLLLIGINSTNIYLCHATIRLYLKQVILLPRHFAFCILWFILLSLAASYVIELLKKAINYNRLINTIMERIK